MKITPFFRWYDIWVGIFIDTKKRTLYICPLPMIGVKVEFIESEYSKKLKLQQIEDEMYFMRRQMEIDQDEFCQ